MLGGKRRERALAAEVRAEQEAAVAATETDDASIDADETLEAEEEP